MLVAGPEVESLAGPDAPAAAERLRLARAIPWLFLATLFAYRISATVVDLDLFHEMALVREWIRAGAFPRIDVFAFTPTIRPTIQHEWGAGVIAYAAAKLFGEPAPLILKYAAGLVFGVVCVRTALRMGGGTGTVLGAGTLAISLVGPGYSPVRAHAYSFALASIVLYCCERDRQGDRRWLWLVPPVFVLWVNVHGGFALGWVLVLLYGVELLVARRPVGHVVLLLTVLAATVAVNPYGLDYYGFIVRSLLLARHSITEWAPLWAPQIPAARKLAFLAGACLVAYALAFGRSRPRHGVVLLVATGLLALKHVRMSPFFGMALVLYVPALLRGSLLSALAERLVERRPRLVAVVAGAAGVAVAAQLWSVRPWKLRVPNEPSSEDAVWGTYYPVGAVNLLRTARFRGDVLTPFNQGSYVSWKLHPDVKVSVDSRFEVSYPDALVDELDRLYETGSGLSDVIAKYRPDVLLVPVDSGLGRSAIPWRRVYQDAGFALYARPGLELALPSGPVSTVDSFP